MNKTSIQEARPLLTARRWLTRVSVLAGTLFALNVFLILQTDFTRFGPFESNSLAHKFSVACEALADPFIGVTDSFTAPFCALVALVLASVRWRHIGWVRRLTYITISY